ncbi:hypothetical protein SAMN04515666_101353 [Bosea lupini]|uniref:Uncharacterized protein n=1 Tax=Bosea lupini TaxID=1036779 RepID=A0A1H7GGX0_9HYPH|nr:hypothetical protein [Bosea lupini]SEK37378.1 hypothetical protein SAMN04515666_101353 [Bosea lupini]
MAPRPGTYSAAFTAGELDLRVHGRPDIKQYYQGAARMQRVVPVPQSGFTNDPVLGTEARGFIRHALRGLQLYPVHITGWAGVAPVSDLLDASTAESTIALGADAVVLTMDLGGPNDIVAFDLYQFSAQVASTNRPLVVQTSLDGVTYTDLGARFGIDTEARSRRFAVPPGQSRLMRFLRLMVTGASSAPGVITLQGIALYANGPASTYRVRPFTRSRAEAYDFVFTENNIDVWGQSGWLAAIYLPASSDQIATLDLVQQLDTMFVFHQDIAPQRIMRQGADDEWTCWPVEFKRIPRVDYGGVYNNGVAAGFSIQFVNLTLPATFALNVSGEETEAIDAQGSTAANEAVIKAAIEALPSVEPGITVAYNGARDLYEVSFTGADNDGDAWSMSGRMVTPATAAIVVSKRQRGQAGGEPVISAARGWPACGAIYQQRLVMGGFRSRPNGWLASVQGDYFDLNTEITANTGAYLAAIDTTGGETIRRIVFGTYLQFLTDEFEYYMTDAALQKNQPPNIRKASKNGIREGVQPVVTDTTTLFIHKNGCNVIEFEYSDAVQNYVGTNISVLSTSLLKDVDDLSFRGAASAGDASTIFVVNADGSMRLLVMLKSQDVVAAPGRFETDGLIRSCSVNGRDEVVLAVDRTVTTGVVQVLERISESVPLDCYVRRQFLVPETVIDGLGAYHEGRTVWAIADGNPFGPFVVAGGRIVLPEPAADVYVGRWLPPVMMTLPVPKDVGEKTVVDRPVRPHSVRAYVLGTSSIAIGTETDGPFDVPLLAFGDAPDRKLLLDPVSKAVAVEGLAGYSDEGKVIVTQLRPGRLSVRNITVEVER